MKYLVFAALITFVAIAVFGFCGFSMDHHTAFMSCVRTLTGGFSCSNNFDMGLKHVGIYQSFSQGIAMSFVFLMALLTMLLAHIEIAQHDFSFSSNFETETYNPFQKIDSWFKLQEKRDPLV